METNSSSENILFIGFNQDCGKELQQQQQTN